MLTDHFYRLRALFRCQRVDDELGDNSEGEVSEYPKAGGCPEETLRCARSAIRCQYQMGGTSRIDDLPKDIRFASRQLRKNPGFTFTAVVVFALGIAASTSIFAFVDAVLVRPLPYRVPSRLVALFERLPIGDRYHLSYSDYVSWKRLNRVFTSLDAYRPQRLTLNAAIGPEEVSGALVSDGFFRTLGVVPILGRDFRPGEDQASAPQTVILKYETWQKRFGADKSVLGRTITLDGDPSIIIGVLPSEFHFAPVEPAEFWRTLHGLCEDSRVCYPYYGVARLKNGVSLSTALSDLASIARQIAIEFPLSNRDRNATVIPLTEAILGDIRPTLFSLLGGAALLSLIGLVNVLSLLLVRTESRKREIAVRSALGASRPRLLRQFAVEAFLVAGSGGILGLTFAYYLIEILSGLVPRRLLDSMPYLVGLHLNWHVVLVALTLVIFGGVLFTVGPALQLVLTDMQEGLMEGGRTAADRSWRKVGASLVVVELAITVMLLMSAGLLAKSFYLLIHQNIGLVADHLAFLHVLKLNDSTDVEQIGLERQIIFRMAAFPSVTSVGVSEELAVGSDEGFKHAFAHFRVLGRSYLGEGDEAIDQMVSVGYFETLRARLLRGRYFAETDDSSKPRVAIVNQTLANENFPGEDPIGKRIISQYDKNHLIEIVGVVDDLKDGPLDMEPTPAVYTPFNQAPTNNFYVTIRTIKPERALLHSMVDLVHQLDPGLVADGEGTMIDRINDSQSAYLHRSAAWVIAGFAALALLLGTVGVYGVTAYSVGRRTREIGVRMALGAQRSSIYALVLKEASLLTLLGMASGALCSFIATGLLRGMLFGLNAWDVEILLSVTSVLVASVLLASYVPARRAAATNPTEALRAE